MADVDDFKSYNDFYGHLEGDQLLKDIANILKQNLRIVDIVCRYGGDEFVAVLPETNYPQACFVAEKIKDAVAYLKNRRKVTLSIGIAHCKDKMERRDLVMKADQGLYIAKRQGKNRVICMD